MGAKQKKGKGKGRQQMMMVPLSMLMGGWGGGNKKGGGKGGRRKSDIGNRTSAEKKVWIGGLPDIEDREKRKEASKKLHEHMKKKGGDCKFAEIWPKGVGVAIYQTEEEAQSAVAEMNGTKFRGKALEIDVWEKKPKA